MTRNLTALVLSLAASPSFAATKNIFSPKFYALDNTDFIVLIGFLIFVGIIVYFKVPSILMGLLDKRAADIQSELEEARKLREEAQALLASYERKAQEMSEQADRIVANARSEAEGAAEAAKAEIATTIERRLAAAEEQIANAEAEATAEVKNRAVTVSIDAARELIAGQVKGDSAKDLIEASITEVGQRLN